MKTSEFVVFSIFFVILLSFEVVAYDEFKLDNATVALFHFNEDFGNILNDESGNGNVGTIFGANWTFDSVNGSALEFDGVDDFVAITKTASVDIVENLTLEAYVKRESNTDGTIISKNGPYFLGIRDNVIAGAVYTNDGNCLSSCVNPGANTWIEVRGITNLSLNVWYKLKMVYDGTKVKIYVNDLLENSISKKGQMPQVSQSIFLGWGEPGQNQFFRGIVDEVRISNVARDSFDVDSDNDNISDFNDLCSNTSLGSIVDSNGCSALQFCASFNPLENERSKKSCKLADWRDNDKRHPKDCKVVKKHRNLECVASEYIN